MVNARSAGIIFTAHPDGGDTSRMIIEANWGLGESVVGRETMPDVFIMEKDSLEIIEKKLGTKGRYVFFRDVVVAEEESTPEKSAIFCLTDEEAKEIGRLSRVLEDHFKTPRNAEWAIDEDQAFPEKIVLLQTRPEVIAPKKSPVDKVLDLMLTRLTPKKNSRI